MTFAAKPSGRIAAAFWGTTPGDYFYPISPSSKSLSSGILGGRYLHFQGISRLYKTGAIGKWQLEQRRNY